MGKTMNNEKVVLCVMAHPDDAEILSAGTLALLKERGWGIVIASMTPGQAGSVVLGPEEISAVRRAEGQAAAAVLKGSYYCIESKDVCIMYDEPTLMNVVRLFRQVNPSVVITASPSDYMLDHEITSHLAQTACMAAVIPNIHITGTVPMARVPHLYYADPVQGKDRLGNEILGDILVDVDTVIHVKEQMLCCHASQREWLRKISGVDEYVILMKTFAERNGKLAGCRYAEGYRQHLGFSYPQDDLLKTTLGKLVHKRISKEHGTI